MTDNSYMGICEDCRLRLEPWAYDYKGVYVGCGAMLKERRHPISEEFFDELVKTKFLGFGWISNGGMSFNGQPIVREVTECPFKEKRS